MFLGIVELQPYPADPTIYQVQHVRQVVNWDRIPHLFSDIRGLLSEASSGASRTPTRPCWSSGARHNRLRPGRLRSARARSPPRAEGTLVGQDVPEADTDPMLQVFVSFLKALDDSGVDVGITMTGLRPTTAGGLDMGIAFAPYVMGGGDIDDPDQRHCHLRDRRLVGSGHRDRLCLPGWFRPGDENRPPRGQHRRRRSTGTSSRPSRWPTRTRPRCNLLTVADGLGITVGSVGVGGGVDVNAGQLSALVSAALTNGVFTLSTKNLDSFVATIIPIDVTCNFNLTLGWSSASGLFIEGNASPHFDINLNTDIGPFHLGVLHLVMTLGQPDLPVEISFDGSASLGPLQVAVQRLGVTADLKFQRGNLGPVDLSLGFKPPTGLGIQIDAGVAAGGGFISFDPDSGPLRRRARRHDRRHHRGQGHRCARHETTRRFHGFLVPHDHHVRVPADSARAWASP